MTSYEQLSNQLEADMVAANNLQTKPEQKNFVQQTMITLYNACQERQITQPEFFRLTNRLAAYEHGTYNDWIDLLVGAASMGMLELVMQENIYSAFSPEQARKRSGTITKLTGIQPHKPDTKKK